MKRSGIIQLTVFGVILGVLGTASGQDAIVRMSGGSGMSGTVGNVVSVVLENAVPISAMQFRIQINPLGTDILSFGGIEPTGRTRQMSIFQSNESVPGEVVVVIGDVGTRTIGPGVGSVARLLLNVGSSAAVGEVDSLILSDAVFSDSLSRSLHGILHGGQFVVESPIISDTVRVGDGAGQVGRLGGPVEVVLVNGEVVGGIQFDLSYDAVGLQIEEIIPTARTRVTGEVVAAFGWDEVVPGVIRVVYGRSILSPGDGSVATVRFRVRGSATPGETDLALSNLLLSGMMGEEVPVVPLDGYFTILEHVNEPPAAREDEAATYETVPIAINVLTNDLDPDGDSLRVISVTPAAHGSVTIGGDSTLIYTPAADFTGTDTFTYTIDDGHGGTDTATVTVTVTSADAALRMSGGSGMSGTVGNVVSVVLENAVPISAMQFRIQINPLGTDILSFGGIEPTGRTRQMSIFQSNESVPGEVVVVIGDVGTRTIGPGVGSVARLLLNVGSSAAVGEVDSLILSDAVFSDSLSRSLHGILHGGQFVVESPIISDTVRVGDGAGQVGRLGGPVEVVLVNGEVVGGIQFDLSYDAVGLQIEEIIPTARTRVTGEVVAAFGWDEVVPGVIRVVYGRSILSPGDGSVATVRFRVRGSATPGETDLALSNLLLSGMMGEEVPVVPLDGHFTILEEMPLIGDVSYNGTVTARDASIVLQFRVGLVDTLMYPGLRPEIADVDRSGEVITLDAAYILQYVIRIVPELPVPH